MLAPFPQRSAFSLENAKRLGATPIHSLLLEREILRVCIFSASYRTMQASETLLLFFFLAAPRHFINASFLRALNKIEVGLTKSTLKFCGC